MNNIREIAAEAVAMLEAETSKRSSVFLCFYLQQVHKDIKPPFWSLVKLYRWFKQRKQLLLWLRELRRQLGNWSTMESYIYDFMYIQNGRTKFARREEKITETANKVRHLILLDAIKGKPIQVHEAMLKCLSEK